MIFTVANIVDVGQATLVNQSGKTLDKLFNQKADVYRILPKYGILYSKNGSYLWNFESNSFYSLDKMPILLSAVVEWKISNPDVFYKSVRTIKGANNIFHSEPVCARFLDKKYPTFRPYDNRLEP